MSSADSGSPIRLARAMAAYERGDLAKAERNCLAVIKSLPEHFDALHLLAVIKCRRGFPLASLEYFARALKLRPGNPDLLNNYASALADLKRPDEALALYDQVLAAQPDRADALNNHGCVMMDLERFEAALASYGNAVVLTPGNAKYINNLGRALAKFDRYAEALACFDDALGLKPDYVDALINRGVVLTELKRFDDALHSLDAALALAPDHIEALLNRARALHGAKRYEEAVGIYADVLAAHPDRSDVAISKAASLTKLFRFDEALRSLDEALAGNADAAKVFSARALTLRGTGDFDGALASVDKALAQHPDFIDAHINRGMVLGDMERLDEAADSYRRALDVRPGDATAEFNLGCLELSRGNFAAGWAHYEARRRGEGSLWIKQEGPEWRGEVLDGQSLLIYAEQAFGDSIQFARFVTRAVQRGAKVIFGVWGPLGELLRSVAGAPVIVRNGEMTPPYDFHIPLMSLPFVMKLTEADLASPPYLRADPERVAAWAEKLPKSGFRIGIAWQGSVASRERSAPLRAFEPLARLAGVRLISLQKNLGVEQLDDLPPGMKIETLGPEFDSGPDAFLDTAAVMMNLDLIISVDTSVAHLAGALGRPLWILLPKPAEWRWQMNRSDSPWYPQARLFRQRTPGDWSAPILKAAGELARLVEHRSDQPGAAPVLAPVSVGELLDKITILEIKAARVTDPQKLREIHTELNLLRQIDYGATRDLDEIRHLTSELREVNETLWEVEDLIRDCERKQDFGAEFVRLARSVYITNDRRAALKRSINELSGSAVFEVKSHPHY